VHIQVVTSVLRHDLFIPIIVYW